MESMSLSEVARATGARVVDRSDGIDGTVRGICTDTRQASDGSLFFALRGENSDGHAYVAQAFEGGCVGAVVEREIDGAAGPQLVVPDALQALGHVARHYREKFSIPVIGITGSVGKTSTKVMVACALRANLDVLASEKNFNNEIGVPLTLFNLAPHHQAAIIEMGMRGPGQIADLCAIARATVGLITNVGITHIELLGSRESIFRAKGELIDSLPEDGLAILPSDDDFAADLRRMAANHRVITFGVRNQADFRATDIAFSPDGASRFNVNGVPFEVRVPGVHHVVNACAACAVAGELGITLTEVAAQLATFRPPAMRMETRELGDGITLLNDAYNAAPDSMRAALETLAMMSGGRRTVAILGDMRELGDWSEPAHRFVGETAAAHRIDLILTIGEAARWIAASTADGSPSIVVSFPDTEMAAREVASLVRPDDIVLVKGSRAMEMERIVEALQARFGRLD